MQQNQLPLSEVSKQRIDADALSNLPDLPASEMDRDALDTLSYIFCHNIHFENFGELLLYYMAREPRKRGLREFWQEVENLGYAKDVYY